MRVIRLHRAGAVSATLLLVALAVAACGEQSDTDRASAKSTPSAASTWLLRTENSSGEDGETKQASYLTISPETGKAVLVRMPKLQVAEASGDQTVLLVDAGRRYALADSRPSAADRARGQVRVVDLDSGTWQVVDVRKASGDPKLTTDWVSFDATKPGLMRVVSGLTVWSVDVDGSNATKEGVLPSRSGWIFGGGFNTNTGTPYIEDTGSFATFPKGNGDNVQRTVRRDGGRLLTNDNGLLPGLPDPRCNLVQGFQDSGGVSWAFCVVGRHVVVKRLADGAKTWKDYGKPTADMVPYNAEPDFVLPKVSTGQ